MPALVGIGARLYRLLPLLIALAVVAAIIYAFVSWKYTDTRAKELLIKIFLGINSVLSALFVLATLYAWAEGNMFVAEFFLTCAIMMIVLLAINVYCRQRFLHNHPNYKWKKTFDALPINKRNKQ